MTKTANSKHTPVRKRKNRTKPQSVEETRHNARPGGKLGLIVDKLAVKRGATADELAEATGWQRHSVLGALSRLKSRGFQFDLDVNATRKAYRLSARKA